MNPTGARIRSASVAVAILVTALGGAPAFAIEQPPGRGDGVTALAKPTDKPRPSHPHATPTPGPTPGPTPTPRITPAPKPKPTPKPDATATPDATPRATERPRKNDPTPRPSKRPPESAETSLGPTSTPRHDSGGMQAPGSGTTSSTGPSPELLGVAFTSAALVGVGSLWFVFGRRRRRPPRPAPAVVNAAAPPPSEERWTNVRLDDNDALPPWLRALSEPERSPLPASAPLLLDERMPLDEPGRVDLPVGEPEPELPARPPATFEQPLEAGAMRLAVGSHRTELLDQPGDFGVVLATLFAGDEVEIQDIAEPWLRVVTPLGTTGWLRSASLGVGGPGEASVAAAPAPAEDLPNHTIEPQESAERPSKRRGPGRPRRSHSAGPAT